MDVALRFSRGNENSAVTLSSAMPQTWDESILIRSGEPQRLADVPHGAPAPGSGSRSQYIGIRLLPIRCP